MLRNENRAGYTAFPVHLLRLIRCVDDDGSLVSDMRADALRDGVVRCTSCARAYRVRRGVLQLLEERTLDEESAHELRLRRAHAEEGDYVQAFRATWRLRQLDRMETEPTLSAMEPLRDAVVLELGCGTGRYTVELAKAARAVIAVDFSAPSLEHLAAKLEDDGRVGLVQADITRLAVAPRAFGRVLSTLVSNLPTRAHRDAMYRLAAEALTDDGTFVFSTHHYGLRERVRRTAKDGRYEAGGIYRRLFTRGDITGELSTHFSAVRSRPIQIVLPFAFRLGVPLVSISRIGERLPGLDLLGQLLLVRARRPLRGEATRPPRAHAAPSETVGVH